MCAQHGVLSVALVPANIRERFGATFPIGSSPPEKPCRPYPGREGEPLDTLVVGEHGR